MPERREHPRARFSRSVRVGTVRELKSMIARDLSEGGLFIAGCDAAVGDRIVVEFEADEIPGARFRAIAEVVRRVEGADGGVGARFERFEEGGSVLAQLVKFLLAPG